MRKYSVKGQGPQAYLCDRGELSVYISKTQSKQQSKQEIQTTTSKLQNVPIKQPGVGRDHQTLRRKDRITGGSVLGKL